MTRLDDKLARIKAGRYTRADFIIADAKDADMGSGVTGTAPHRQPDGSWTRYRTRAEFLDQIQAVIDQDVVDLMLVSPSNLELLHERKAFAAGLVKPAIRANDTTDCWGGVRGGSYAKHPSRAFRTANINRVMYGTVDPNARGPDHGHGPRTLFGDLPQRSRRRCRGARCVLGLPRRCSPQRVQILSSKCSTPTSRPGWTARPWEPSSTTASCAASRAC